jgi:ribosomal protein L40E
MHTPNRPRSKLMSRVIKWTCDRCGAINPNITGTCIRCGS